MSQSITSAVAQQFIKSARAKGDDYAAMGLVRIESRSPDDIRAIVAGREPYRVSIARRKDGQAGFNVSCTCPYYDQEFAPCKHLWATFVVADREGLLAANGTSADTVDLKLLEPRTTAAITSALTRNPPSNRNARTAVSERMRAYWAARRANSQPRRAAAPPDPGAMALARIESFLQAREYES